MIDAALMFLQGELNAYLLGRFGGSADLITLSPLVLPDGESAITTRLGMALINVEEERVFKSHNRHVVTPSQVTSYSEPELRLTLHIMVAAAATSSGSNYEEALKSLTAVVTFFQSRGSFTATKYPALDTGIEKLVVELETVDYEAQNNIWSALGGKFQPSVQYRVRLVPIHEALVEGIAPPIEEIDAKVAG